MADIAVEARELKRSFNKGKFVAVNGLSLDIKYGQIHALLGPNGAGKTTTVKMLTTLLQPDSGSVKIAGVDAVKNPTSARRKLGLVLGGDLGFYPRASAQQNLCFFADIQGVPSAKRHQRVAQVLQDVQLTQYADTKVSGFSRGMKQRLHIARALLHEPRILFLDEPTTGLDPDISLEIRDLVSRLARQGVAVLLTSHSMAEVEELADQISLIGAGKLVISGQVQDIAACAGFDRCSTFTLTPAQDGRLKLNELLPGAVVHERRPLSAQWLHTIYWPQEQSSAALEAELKRQLGQLPADYLCRPASLEQAYLAMADRLSR